MLRTVLTALVAGGLAAIHGWQVGRFLQGLCRTVTER